MHSPNGYGSMMADRVRMDAYREALCRTVRPGSIVVDLGAGPGIMSCLAVQFGAAKIYAIDPSETLETGRAIARANGFENRIEFHRAFSNAVNLPERADVIVADMRGVLPAFGGNFQAIADARSRFLKPGGILIPQRDTLHVALAESLAKYSDLVKGWHSPVIDLSAGRRTALNNWTKTNLTASELLSTPAKWAQIDYRTVTHSALSGSASTEVLRPGTAHGLCAWFDAELLAGIGFSNAPGQPEAIYGQAFFPLLEPIAVEPGDHADIDIRGDLTGDDYTWSWHTAIYSADRQLKAEYRQSTFLGLPLSAHNLQKRAAGFVPQPSEDARIDRMILDLFGSERPLRDIAAEVAVRFPQRFNGWKAALDRVAAMSARYSD